MDLFSHACFALHHANYIPEINIKNTLNLNFQF